MATSEVSVNNSREGKLVSLESVTEANESADGLLQKASALFALPNLRSKTFQRVRKGASAIFGDSDSPRQGPHLSENEAQQYFLRKEVQEARNSISKLETKCENAQSYREKSSKLLEEAHRALGRLEQAMLRKDSEDLIVAASEIKAGVQQGLTLINVYGGLGTMAKFATILMRKSINTKYDEVTSKLASLVPPPPSVPSNPQGPPMSLTSVTSDQLPPVAQLKDKTSLARFSPTLSQLASAATRGSAREIAARDPAPAPLATEGTIIKNAKHEKIYCVAPWCPAKFSNNGYINLWWSVGHTIEHWTDAGCSTTSFAVDKDIHIVTTMGMDDAGNMWTGHIKGLLRVRQRNSWDSVAEDKAFSSQIKCIEFDDSGLAWVGAVCGKVKIFRYHDSASDSDGIQTKSHLELVATLQQSLVAKMVQGAKTMFVPSVWNLLNGRQSCKGDKSGHSHVQELMSEGPVRAIFVREDRAWISGGQSYCKPWLAMFDSVTFQDLDVYECVGVGPANVIRPLNWPQQAVLGHASTRHERNMASNHPSERNLATVSQQLTPVNWRLLTGHENGQLLMWHPRATGLAPLIKIGEPCSSIRGIHIFEETSLVITAHHCGQLQMFVQQRMDNMLLPPGTESQHPDTLGTLRPKKTVIKAHKSNLVGMSGAQNWFATASLQGTIRLWRLPELMVHVERAGLVVCEERQPTLSNAASSHHMRNSSLSNTTLTTPGDPMNSAPSSAPRTRSGLTDNDAVPQAPTSGGSGNDRGTYSTRRASSGVASDQVPSAADSLAPSTSAATGAHHGFTSSCQTIEASELSLKKIIGRGAYGQVWLAEWTGCAVAVKELTGFCGCSDDVKLWQEMSNEVHLLGTYNHPNIMRFMAVCIDPPMIVMQYYAHGSLFDLLQRARKNNARATKELAWGKRLDMLRDVAAGMHYLHTRKPPVIHGDLRSPNLLLDLTIDRERPRFHVKIADFGLARLMGPTSSLVMVSKTTNPRWTAPEVIKSSSIGPAADVYSFAIIMWEVLTWQQPYEDMMSVQVILRTVCDNDRPVMPTDDMIPGSPGVTLKEYKQLMEKCWSQDSAERPTFKQIVDHFQAMRDIEAKFARSNSGTSSQGPPRPPGTQSPAPATPALTSAATTPTATTLRNTSFTAHQAASDPPPATGSTTASNSASSVKSDTAALLANAAAAKDSASSIALHETSGLLMAGAAGKGVLGKGGSMPPAMTQINVGTGAQNPSQTLPPTGLMMSPIVEERSTSADLHQVARAYSGATPVNSIPTAAMSQTQGPAANTGNTAGSPFANGPPQLFTGMVHYAEATGSTPGPFNLLDGDDGSDPLEAYRSGAMDDFGYSMTGNVPSAAVLGPVIEEHSDSERGGSRHGSPARFGAPRAVRVAGPAGGSPKHQPGSPLGRAAGVGAGAGTRVTHPVAASQDSTSLANMAVRGRSAGDAPVAGVRAPSVNPFGAASVAWAGTMPGAALAGQRSGVAGHPVYEGPEDHTSSVKTHPRTSSPAVVRGGGGAPAAAERQLSTANSLGRAQAAHRSSRSHDQREFQQLTAQLSVEQSGGSRTAMGKSLQRVSPRGSAAASPVRTNRTPVTPSPAFGSSSPAHHTPAAAGSQASRLRAGATAHGAAQQPNRRTADANSVPDFRRSTEGSLHTHLPDNSHGQARGIPPRSRPSGTHLSGGTPASSRGTSPQRAHSGNTSLIPDPHHTPSTAASNTGRTSGASRLPTKPSSGAPSAPGLNRSTSTNVHGIQHTGAGATPASRLKQPAGQQQQQQSTPGPSAKGGRTPMSPGASSAASSHRGPTMSAGRGQSGELAPQYAMGHTQHQRTSSSGIGNECPITPGSSSTGPQGFGSASPLPHPMAAAVSATEASNSPGNSVPLGVYRMNSEALGLPHEQAAAMQAGTAWPGQRFAGTPSPSKNANAAEPELKPYAPLSAYSPFAGSTVPFSAEERSSVERQAASTAAAVTTQSPEAKGAQAVDAFTPQAAKYYAPMSAYSPFANNSPTQPEQAATPAPMQQQGGSSSNTGEENFYAPMSKFSPFAAANQSTNPTASPAAAAHTAQTDADGKPWAPLSALSPFASPPAAAPQSAAGSTSAHVSNNGDAKPWAPLSALSPFASPSAVSTHQAAQANGGTDSDAKPWAPLSALSPFASPAPAKQPAPTDGADAKPWAPLSALSPFASPSAEPSAQAAISSNGDDKVVFDSGKPYAPLSPLSPFSGAAQQATW